MNLRELVVYYNGLFWDFIHSGHKFCAERIYIVGSETYKGIVL